MSKRVSAKLALKVILGRFAEPFRRQFPARRRAFLPKLCELDEIRLLVQVGHPFGLLKLSGKDFVNRINARRSRKILFLCFLDCFLLYILCVNHRAGWWFCESRVVVPIDSPTWFCGLSGSQCDLSKSA